MKEEIISPTEQLDGLALYSDDLAPVPKKGRTWGVCDLAAIWVGMAVCIPTYLLASYMIKSGLSWYAALIIIGLANLIITVPMVLNGHAGVKYGIPFPVIGRASFGYRGIHLPAVLRGIVACGWFGVQTWIGGLAVYAIFNALTGAEAAEGLSLGKFLGFGVFWLINMFFIVRGTESIRWLEDFAAPILILSGVLLIIWGASTTGGFSKVLTLGAQLQQESAAITQEKDEYLLKINPLTNSSGEVKATHYRYSINADPQQAKWINITMDGNTVSIPKSSILSDAGISPKFYVQFKNDAGQKEILSSILEVDNNAVSKSGFGSTVWGYLLWLTAMVGFWATMSLSIADITRYAASQKVQIKGQFLGLPGAMILYSFVGIFVTFAAAINFSDILVAEDAPWDPVSLLTHFEHPALVVIAQLFMIIATLSTNIAANVIAPANAFSNLNPRKISFKAGGVITGIIGILICPWWLLDEISGILIFISGLLGPVLGIMLADYYWFRRTELNLNDLYKTNGVYSYGNSGINHVAMISMIGGIVLALIGYWVPVLSFLYKLSWFTGFLFSFFTYYMLMRKQRLN